MNKKYSGLSRQTLLFLAGAVLLAACGLAPTLPEANAGNKDDDSPIKLGPGASLGGKRLFPDDNPWNQDISREPLDPNSDNLIASIGTDRPLHPDFGTVYQGAPSGIPYVVVDGNQGKVPVTFEYADESDKGPYPIPPDAPI